MKVEEIEVGGVYGRGKVMRYVRFIGGGSIVFNAGDCSRGTAYGGKIESFAKWATKRIDTREESHAQAE